MMEKYTAQSPMLKPNQKQQHWVFLSMLSIFLGVITACQDISRPPTNEGSFLPPGVYMGATEAGNTAGTNAGINAGNQGGENAGTAGGQSLELDMLKPDMEIVDLQLVDSASFEPIAFAIETRVGERFTEAGIGNRVTCQLLDQLGNPILAPNLIPQVTPSNGFERVEEDGVQILIGQRAGEYQITCKAPEYGLIDQTPALWTVQHSAVYRTQTVIHTNQIHTGEDIGVDCLAYDAFGNAIDNAEFEEQITPNDLGVQKVGPTWRFNRSGEYLIRCHHPTAQAFEDQALFVLPNLPKTISVSVYPDQPIYRVGQVIEIETVVTDDLGNILEDAEIEIEAPMGFRSFGSRRFRLDSEGIFEVFARVTSETQNNRDVESSVEVVVDFGGPGIRCLSPAMGGIERIPEGGMIQLTGQVGDLLGIQSLTVDGNAVAVDESGMFTVAVPAVWGLNVHDIVASDGINESSTFCAFFAAETFVPERQMINNVLSLFLGQGTIDDGGPENPLRSVGDVLRRVINSQGLVDSVNQAARARNPIVPEECRVRFLGCIFSFGAEFTGFGLSNQNRLNFTMLEDGIQIRTSLRDIWVSARFLGTLGNRARISTSGITIDISFNATKGFGGTPQINVRSINEVTVERLDADFSGFITGFILELAFSAFEGLIRNTITDTIRDFLSRELDRTLTDLFGNVQVGTLEQGIDVPNLLQTSSLRLQLLAELSTLKFSPQGILLAIGTKFDVLRNDGNPNIAQRGIGVPLIPAGNPPFPSADPVGASIQINLLNQALFALWRGGFFDIQDSGLADSLNAGLPEGVEMMMSLPAPPLVEGIEGQSGVKITIGPFYAKVLYPGLFEVPFPVQTVSQLEATMRLEGEREIRFENVNMSYLKLSLGEGLPDASRQRLESVLRNIITRLIDRSLNSALPVLPLPELTLPSGFESFNLPANTRLGLRQPVLFGNRGLWKLTGAFGE